MALRLQFVRFVSLALVLWISRVLVTGRPADAVYSGRIGLLPESVVTPLKQQISQDVLGMPQHCSPSTRIMMRATVVNATWWVSLERQFEASMLALIEESVLGFAAGLVDQFQRTALRQPTAGANQLAQQQRHSELHYPSPGSLPSAAKRSPQSHMMFENELTGTARDSKSRRRHGTMHHVRLARQRLAHSRPLEVTDTVLVPSDHDAGVVSHPPDCEVLAELYASTGGPSWQPTNWGQSLPANFSSACCSPPLGGYVCDAATGRIVEIVLHSNHLNGSIPESLGTLSKLQQLDLSLNLLTGSIPESLGTLSQLHYLDLSFNQLPESIPQSLGNMLQLQYLDLSSNQLTGSIPQSLGDLPELQLLDLSLNQLNGSIPVSLSNLSELQLLDLSFNQLKGSIPASLGNLSQLQSFIVSSNQLAGSIPAFFEGTSQLEILDVHENKFSQFPASLCNMTSLQVVVLSKNELTEFANCSSAPFVTLMLSDNQLSAFPFGTVFSWPSLQSLDVSRNMLGGSFPLVPNKLSLKVLSLAHNNFTDAFPLSPCGHNYADGKSDFPAASPSSGLFFLDVSGNHVSGFGFGNPSQNCQLLCSLRYWSLTTLKLSGTHLLGTSTDPICNAFGSTWNHGFLPISDFLQLFPSLQTLDLSGNDVNGSLDSIFELPQLVSLDLTGNPSLRLDVALSPQNRKKVQLNPLTLYAYSDAMTCYQATYELLTVQVDPAFFAYSNCQCRPGYYGKPPSCQKCKGSLLDATCSFQSDDLPKAFKFDPAAAWNASGNIIANEGFYASPSFTYDEMVADIGYPSFIQPCRGAATDETPCKPSTSGPCSRGYEGRLCSKCASDFFHSGDSCLSCPSGVSLVLFGMIIVLVLIGLILWSFFVGTSASGSAKIIVFFSQSLFFIRPPMTSGLYSTTHSGSSFAMLSLAGPKCFYPEWSFDTNYAVAVSSTVMFPVISGLIWSIGALMMRVSRRSSPARSRAWLDRCLRSALFLSVFLYMQAVNAILAPLACTRDEGDGKEYLIAVPYHRCSPKLRDVSIVFLTVYVIGGPILLALIVSRSGATKQNDATTTRRHYVYSLLFDSYRPGCLWWEFIVTVRRVLFVAAFATVQARSSLQALLVLAVLGGSVLLGSLFSPFASRAENSLETLALLVLLLNFGIELKSLAVGSVDVETAGAVIFALNTVTFVSLVAAIFHDQWRSVMDSAASAIATGFKGIVGEKKSRRRRTGSMSRSSTQLDSALLQTSQNDGL
ncbi:conserved mitochondrial leucine-rich repeat (LRR_4) and EGF_Lam domain-containing protein [Andalucia godoyi]|uniref:Conserved mitochondrial leucine-rich repeat (LRR_4) and EGF_Lam domain-containing protein n=1 Tax=Andalucia godoyi TaxID=505711 RepID=A0A8K0AJU5_ANDGO|nr:conserved mitochondrial leucine-rich repeat (LRR_4) and EGF_Lam domain-containing protein [Andalucia godoyi]|eukprot:ANDGO_01900.mRNA.1 conserved mitochondrial leucine-rich repeat (LRR_4) and EGF_Lam domain-containing protein